MAKMFFSLGFWMTIMLFIMLGYALGAFGYSFGADCAGSVNCGAGQPAMVSPVLPEVNRNPENDLPSRDVFPRVRCTPNATPHSNIFDFQQMANLQAGGPTYAPGLSLSTSSSDDEVSLCPGPIEIPRH